MIKVEAWNKRTTPWIPCEIITGLEGKGRELFTIFNCSCGAPVMVVEESTGKKWIYFKPVEE
jgi:hypothetical protein